MSDGHLKVLRHLVQYGPARNEAERDKLLAALDEPESPAQAPQEASK